MEVCCTSLFILLQNEITVINAKLDLCFKQIIILVIVTNGFLSHAVTFWLTQLSIVLGQNIYDVALISSEKYKTVKISPNNEKRNNLH